MRALALIFALLIAGLPAEAKLFKNTYVSFEMPNDWNCVLDGTEWVCRNQSNPQAAREAIMILTAKEAGPMDNLNAYLQHLKTPRVLASASGSPLQSQILRAQQRVINNHPWIDAMHLGSEIPNYYSRYLATTKDSLGILVTLSAHRLHYNKYANSFLKTIESLNALSTKGLKNAAGSGGIGSRGGTIGTGGPSIPMDEMPLDEEPGAGSGSATSDAVMGGAFLLLAAAIYIFMRRRKR